MVKVEPIHKIGGFSFEIVKNEAYLKSCDGDAEFVSIPEYCDEYIVTKILDKAFYGNEKIVTVEIPDTVKEIRERAFMNCKNLKSVRLPVDIMYIPLSCFENCVSLEGISLPEKVRMIYHHAFKNCISLSKIQVPMSVTFFGCGCFNNCNMLRAYYCSVKGFALTENGELYCQPFYEKFPYKLDKTTKLKTQDELVVGKNGIHLTMNAFEIFDSYYGEYGKDFCVCECIISKGKILDENGEKRGMTKCTKELTPIDKFTRRELINILNRYPKTKRANTKRDCLEDFRIAKKNYKEQTGKRLTYSEFQAKQYWLKRHEADGSKRKIISKWYIPPTEIQTGMCHWTEEKINQIAKEYYDEHKSVQAIATSLCVPVTEVLKLINSNLWNKR